MITGRSGTVCTPLPLLHICRQTVGISCFSHQVWADLFVLHFGASIQDREMHSPLGTTRLMSRRGTPESLPFKPSETMMRICVGKAEHGSSHDVTMRIGLWRPRVHMAPQRPVGSCLLSFVLYTCACRCRGADAREILS